MVFELKKTAIFQALTLNKVLIFKRASVFSFIFLFLGLCFFSLFSFGVLKGIFADTYLDKFLAGALFCFALGFAALEIHFFFISCFKKPKTNYSLRDLLQRQDYLNLASFLDIEAALIAQKAARKAKAKGLKEPASCFLVLGLLESDFPLINFVLKRAELNEKELKEDLKRELIRFEKSEEQNYKASQEFEMVMLKAAQIAEEKGQERIGLASLITALAQTNNSFINFLTAYDLNKQDIANLAFWFDIALKRKEKAKKFWLYQNMLRRGSLGRDFASGFSLNLDKYSTDLRDKLHKGILKETSFHQKEIERVEGILEKKEINNVLLVGEPGSGRESIVEAVVQRAFLGKIGESLNHKRFLMFDPSILASQITSFEKAESVLDSCFAEAVRAGNVVLIINNFEQFALEEIRTGVLNIIGTLSRYLPLSSFQIIAITSYDGLHHIIERNTSLLNLFEKVEVLEMSQEETFELLQDLVPGFEKKYNCFITYKALREILQLSSRYLKQMPFPEKAIRLLDEALAHLSSYKEKVLRESFIKKLVSEKTEIPLEDLEQKEKQTLLNLEHLIHQRIINQEEAVHQTASALRRARSEVRSRKGPIGSFLFLGPTGVGKTETSKALSALYFGSEKRMVRLDMTEFQNVSDTARLLGSAENEGLLTTPIKENPFSLLLLDEIEKAHSNILNLFLQVLDEGWITDGLGRKIDFQNTIIIATSNAGSEIIRRDIEYDKKMDLIKEELLDHLFREAIFRPEFINRFDAVVIFKPLSKEHLLAIAGLMLKKLSDNLQDKGIKFEITDGLKRKIMELSYNPAFGAREMQRVIQDKVENLFANAILSGKIKRNDRVLVNPVNMILEIKGREENE